MVIVNEYFKFPLTFNFIQDPIIFLSSYNFLLMKKRLDKKIEQQDYENST